jgi:methionine biosynthesis protein MetW
MKKYLEAEKFPKYGSISQIINNIEKNKTVLDVGCSEGYVAKHLQNNIVYGIDYNAKALEKAKNFCKDVKVVDLNNLDELDDLFPNVKYDYIVFADVLEHVLYPKEVIKKLKTKLKKGGYIIISLPNVALWRVRLNLLFGKFDYTEYGVLDDTHLKLYTFKTAEKLIKDCDLNLVKILGAANALGYIVHKFKFLRNIFSIQIITISKND